MKYTINEEEKILEFHHPLTVKELKEVFDKFSNVDAYTVVISPVFKTHINTRGEILHDNFDKGNIIATYD